MKNSFEPNASPSSYRDTKQKLNKSLFWESDVSADFNQPGSLNEFRLFEENDIYDQSSQFFFNPDYKRDPEAMCEEVEIGGHDPEFTNFEHDDPGQPRNASYKNDEKSDNDNWFELIKHIVHDSGIQSDEESKDYEPPLSKLLPSKFREIPKIDTDDYKVKSVKPRAKLIRK